MQKTQIHNVDEEVCKGLDRTIGRRKMSGFLQELVQPHVARPNLECQYAEMAGDKRREREALEWAETTFKDVAHGTRRALVSPFRRHCWCIVALSTIAATAHGEGPRLTPEQQRVFLASRAPSGSMTGSFSSFASLLYAMQEVVIHSSDSRINATVLASFFPDFYKPTWREYLDDIARQSKCSYSHDAQTGYWVFSEPENSLPYSVDLAEGWTCHDEGRYVGYAPRGAPVGMDLYMLGEYSASPSEEAALYRRVRDALAITFASNFKQDVGITEMQEVLVDGAEALYFEAPAPRPGTLWRQWVFVKNGRAFAIVSAAAQDDAKVRSEIDGMIKSFHATLPRDPSRPS
ncbi:MAG: hypothetical protein AB1714_02705 [Acidobacteriota bacterium]